MTSLIANVSKANAVSRPKCQVILGFDKKCFQNSFACHAFPSYVLSKEVSNHLWMGRI